MMTLIDTRLNEPIKQTYDYRISHNQMHFLYQQRVMCSCDTENIVKVCFIEVLSGQIALSIIDETGFSHQSIQRSNYV